MHPLAALLVTLLTAPDGGAPLTWQTHHFEPAHIDIDFPTGEVSEAKWETGGGTLFQQLSGGKDVVRLSVRAEAAEGLDAFRADHQQWKFGAPTQVKVCGVSAQRLEATRPLQHITCVATGDGNNHPAYVPAQRATVIAFKWKGQVVRLTAEAESDRPNAFDAELKRFLDSVRCW